MNKYDRNRCRYELVVSSAGTTLKTVKTTETHYRTTETNITEYSENRGKPQSRQRKTDAEHRSTQKPRTGRAGIEPTIIGAMASATAH